MPKAHAPPVKPEPALTPDQIAVASKANEETAKKFKPDDWKEIIQKIKNSCGEGAMITGAVKVCKRIKNLNCAGPNPDRNARMSKSMSESINKVQGTKVDFDQIAQWEGGQAVKGYVPWWPNDVSVKDGLISADTKLAKDGASLKGSSNSGVTIGSGVDLGGQDPTTYLARLKKAGASQALMDKLKPYMGLKRTAACRYLRDHPLTISKEEADLIDKDMKSAHLDDTITQYNGNVKSIKNAKKFNELSEQEQTVLTSRHYQDGNITNSNASRELSRDMARGETQRAADRLTSTNYPGHAGRIPAENIYLQPSISPLPKPSK